MLEEINYSAKIKCDVCGRHVDGDIRNFFSSGWAIVPMTRTRWKSGKFVDDVTACAGCLYIRRFGEKANISLYGNRDEVLRKWAEIEAGDE